MRYHEYVGTIVKNRFGSTLVKSLIKLVKNPQIIHVLTLTFKNQINFYLLRLMMCSESENRSVWGSLI